MKFICKRELLSEALSNVSKSVSMKSTIPALEGVLIKTENDKINLYGYNLELLISTKIKAKIIKEGEVVINTKVINDLIKKIQSEDIEFFVNENNIATIKGGITECNIMCYNKQEYPELPKTEGDILCEIDEEIFKSMIDKTIFSVAQNDQKPVHTGMLFEFSEDELTIVAVDGFRISIRKEKIKNKTLAKFIVPSKTMYEISKLIKDNEKLVKISTRPRTIIFEFKEYVIVSRTLEGDFLDYKKIINKDITLNLNISTMDFLECVERVSIIINERNKTPIVINFTDENKIKFSCTSAIGNIYDELYTKEKINNFKIGFNNKYILEAFRACCEENVKIFIQDPLSPMKIVPIDGDGFLYLILPVRLKDE